MYFVSQIEVSQYQLFLTTGIELRSSACYSNALTNELKSRFLEIFYKNINSFTIKCLFLINCVIVRSYRKESKILEKHITVLNVQSYIYLCKITNILFKIQHVFLKNSTITHKVLQAFCRCKTSDGNMGSRATSYPSSRQRHNFPYSQAVAVPLTS